MRIAALERAKDIEQERTFQIPEISFGRNLYRAVVIQQVACWVVPMALVKKTPSLTDAFLRPKNSALLKERFFVNIDSMKQFFTLPFT
ncbi:MAG: hypothetical protein CMJ77_08330 [Planctomycetaceae bacterium]|nr:hypothetical protein [Planctomycetaceae bacterium]